MRLKKNILRLVEMILEQMKQITKAELEKKED